MIAFIGASTANLYGARYAHTRGHDVIIFETLERGIATDAYLREVIEHRVVFSGAEALVRMIMDARDP